MSTHGRPVTKPVQLRDGFYIEVCNKGNTKGVKIRCDSKVSMQEAATRYSMGKDVIILGEYKDGSALTARAK